MTAQWIKFSALAVLAAAAAVSGLKATRFWRLSTDVTAEPEGFEPVVPELKQIWWVIAHHEASEKMAQLNRKASFWTAVSVILGGAAAIVGAWP
jgi:hypothetical protein